MNSSSSLTNLNIQTPHLKAFKGIKDGEASSVFNKNGELSTSNSFGRKVKKLTEPLRKSSFSARKDREDYRKDLSNRRAQILCPKSEMPEKQLNIESQLLDLVKQVSSDQVKTDKPIVEVKPLLKQIQQDICFYFTNEIRQCNSPTKLKDLHSRIELLTPTSEYDRDSDRKLDGKSIETLKNELNSQCDRVVHQLNIELNPKLNQATGEVNSESYKSSNSLTLETLEVKCDDIICWIDTIRDISPNVFGDRRDKMCQLLRGTFLSGLDSINYHSDDLNETKTAFSKIPEISETVSKAIKDNTDDSQKTLKAVSKATSSKQSILEEQLNQLPNAGDNYSICSKALDQSREKVFSHLNELSNTQKAIGEKQIEIKNLQSTKKPMNVRERKLPFNFNRKINSQISKINKEISSLNKKEKTLSSSMAKEKERYNNLEQDLIKAETEFNDLVKRYGSSLRCLDGLDNVSVDNQGNPEPKAILSALGKLEDPTTSTKPRNSQTIELPKDIYNNKSLSGSPENLRKLTAFINEKISGNPELSKTLPKLLTFYSQLLQPQSDDNEWRFNETFDSFVASCKILSDHENSVDDARDHLYNLITTDYGDTRQNIDDVYNEEIDSASEYKPITNSGNLAADISNYLRDIDREAVNEDDFGESEIISAIEDAISEHPDFRNLADNAKYDEIIEHLAQSTPSEEEVRDILNQLRS